MNTSAHPALAGYLTHGDVARQLGQPYFAAYSLGVTGALGEPVTVGRTKLFPRESAERTIALKLAERRARQERP